LTTVINKLKEKAGDNFPKQVKLATLYYKPKHNVTDIEPDYFLYKTDKWLVFPHELIGLSHEEIMKYKEKEIRPFFKGEERCIE